MKSAKRSRGRNAAAASWVDDMLSRLMTPCAGERRSAGQRDSPALPVAMIDEFQDTDPQQYRIFRRIWRRQADTALLLIGDPSRLFTPSAARISLPT